MDSTPVDDVSTRETTKTCVSYSERYPDLASSPYAVATFSAIYALIFLVGVSGNVAIIYVTLTYKQLQNVRNMLLLNLAASDVMVCLISLPITPVTNMYKTWHFGEALCRAIPLVQGVGIFVCTLSLGAIAVDRYVLVLKPHSKPLTRRGVLVVTSALWSISLIATAPYAVFMKLQTDESGEICGMFCTEAWPNDSSRIAYTIVVVVLQFVLPFIVMAFCYTVIFYRLRVRTQVRLQRLDARSAALVGSTKRTVAITTSTASSTVAVTKKNVKEGSSKNGTIVNGTNGTSNGGDATEETSERAHVAARMRRTTLILVSMVLVFLLTWLPQNVLSFVIEIHGDDPTFFNWRDDPDYNYQYLANLFTHSIAMLSTVSNPVLYAWLNPAFRDLVLELLAPARRALRRERAESRRDMLSGTTRTLIGGGTASCGGGGGGGGGETTVSNTAAAPTPSPPPLSGLRLQRSHAGTLYHSDDGHQDASQL